VGGYSACQRAKEEGGGGGIVYSVPETEAKSSKNQSAFSGGWGRRGEK